jgi:RNA polymerase sigma-70 factor (ECF subfamily)
VEIRKNTKHESEWVEKIRYGNAEAFEYLFKTYCQQLINFACRFVKDTQIAENIVQDVFLKIWSIKRELNPSLNIKSYLYTAVKNGALKQLRNKAVERRAADRLQSLSHETHTPEDEWNEKEVNTAILQAIADLPKKCGLIFSMNRYDGLTYKEIAEIQNISIKTVETQMSRALKYLRKRLIHFFSVFPL